MEAAAAIDEVLQTSELLTMILANLEARSLARASMSCQIMANCGGQDSLWRTVCERQWPSSSGIEGITQYRAFARRLSLKAKPPDPTLEMSDVQLMLRLSRLSPLSVGDKLEVRPGFAKRVGHQDWCPAVVVATDLPYPNSSSLFLTDVFLDERDYVRVQFDDPSAAGVDFMTVYPDNPRWVRQFTNSAATVFEGALHGRDCPREGKFSTEITPPFEAIGAGAAGLDDSFVFCGNWLLTVIAFRASDEKTCTLIDKAAWRGPKHPESTWEINLEPEINCNLYTGIGQQKYFGDTFDGITYNAQNREIWFNASISVASQSKLEICLQMVRAGSVGPNENGDFETQYEDVDIGEEVLGYLAAAPWY